ncbi:MAG TPA: hypothetical protein VH643_25320 [Gemmataceae bacterium]|jgi:hypothetical protein
MERFMALNLKLGDHCGEDYRLGSALPHLFRLTGEVSGRSGDAGEAM